MNSIEDSVFGFCNMDALKMQGQVGKSRLKQTTSLSNALHYNCRCLKLSVCNERYEFLKLKKR